ncbi:CoA-transferase subunit beta [Bailinhaonella thermotolerans]|uniref:CoA-transferase n=1 Tax=Bailinhaonella thermotolerans TaxID=1070861 RepID=A0A3A3ZZH6_9ACTN|nr:CoA-transferase [Bailinhaonella thermotolerans]RJL20684.1 CoA-transferase [Bailinhaonella thermotolerans]
MSGAPAGAASGSDATRAEVCVVACAEAWRGDGEVLAAAMGVCSVLGARLARLTFEPGLLTTDGGALLTAEPIPLGAPAGAVEGWMPFRDHLWLVLNGRRHVMMGASQIDRHGNTNISAIGPWAKPVSQLLGVRGAPGNTRLNPTSYWIPRHSTRVFVERVDTVSGVGTDRGAHGLRRVVTDLGVFDLGGPGGTMRLLSAHPGVEVAEIIGRTGFALDVPAEVPETRRPTGEELRLIREVLDPEGRRDREVRP